MVEVVTVVEPAAHATLAVVLILLWLLAVAIYYVLNYIMTSCHIHHDHMRMAYMTLYVAVGRSPPLYFGALHVHCHLSYQKYS